MLEISDLAIRYGPFLAVDGVSIKVEAKEIVGIVGPNGAGKSSIVRAISGLVTPVAGEVRFFGNDLSSVAPHQRIRLGISVVPEGRGLFPRMSVEENLLMGGYSLKDPSKRKKFIERGFSLFPILAERRKQMAGTLSGGQQQMLAISVGLMSEPTLLVLDEPSLGLAPIVIGQIGQALRALGDGGLSVLLFEQNAKLTCSVSRRIYIVASGRVQHHDVADKLLSNPQLIDHLI